MAGKGGRGHKKPIEMNSSQRVSLTIDDPPPKKARAPQRRKDQANKSHLFVANAHLLAGFIR